MKDIKSLVFCRRKAGGNVNGTHAGWFCAYLLHFGYAHHLFMSDISRGSGEDDLENPLGCKQPSAKCNVAPRLLCMAQPSVE